MKALLIVFGLLFWVLSARDTSALEIQEKDMSTFLWAVCIHAGKHETQECLVVRDTYVSEGMAAEGKRKSELVTNLYLYLGYLVGVDEARALKVEECKA